jgi:hypothetical protein
MRIGWINVVDKDGRGEEDIFNEEDGGEGPKYIMSWLQRRFRGREEEGTKLFEKKYVDRKSEER